MGMNWKRITVTASMLATTATLAASSAVAQIPKATPAPPAPPKNMTWVYNTGGSGSGSYLGVDITEVSSDRVSALKLKDEHGVEVTMVDRDAPAGKAGVKEHDVILDFNGNRVEGEEQLRRMLRETPPGREVTLGISRDGQPMQLKATLGDRRKMATKIWNTQTMPPMAMPEPPEMPDMPGVQAFTVLRSYSRVAGMMVGNLTPQLGEFFGVKSGEGVLVQSVEKGSAAEAGGLKAGDVITKVNGEKVSNQSDWNRAMMRKSGKVTVGIIRDKREQTLTLTLPERRNRDDSRMRMFPGKSEELDFDMDMDTDFDIGELENLNTLPMINEQIRLVLPQAQRQIALAQLEVARRMKLIQPKINVELNNAQKQIEREMKTLELKLQRLNQE
ncbi:MAG: Pdz/Dhr/GlgF [Acidobacteriales bacterium]|nr:Pdz/Dhr/GlgF [Terriglobales bacterium]